MFKEKFTLPDLLGVTAEAEEQRNELAIAAGKITAVTTPEQNESAVGASRDIQTYLRKVKERGLDFRRPINDFTDLVKKTEDDHLAPLLPEKDRLDSLALGFAQAERRRVEAEEQRQREEYARQEAAKQVELKRIAEEQAWREREAKRLQDEMDSKAQAAADVAAALAAAATNKKMREAAEDARQVALRKQAAAEVERQRITAALAIKAAADAAAMAATEQGIQDLLRQPAPQAVKAAGSTVKTVMCYEVLDAAMVFRSRPELCKIEVKSQAVSSTCKAKVGSTSVAKDTTSVLGLALWYEEDLSVRRR